MKFFSFLIKFHANYGHISTPKLRKYTFTADHVCVSLSTGKKLDHFVHICQSSTSHFNSMNSKHFFNSSLFALHENSSKILLQDFQLKTSL